MKALARFFSYAFHPLFMPLITMMVCLQFDSFLYAFLMPKVRITLYGVLFINTIVIPIITLFYMKRKQLITTLEIKEQKERTLPYFMVFLYYLLTYVVLRNTGLPSIVFSLIFSGVVGAGLALLVNFSWKISAHSIGVGGLVGAYSGLVLSGTSSSQLLILLWLLAGAVLSARLILKAHTNSQVYVGFLSGFFVALVLVLNSWFI